MKEVTHRGVNRWVRVLRAGGIGLVLTAAGTWAWRTVQDVRLRGAFEEALERRGDNMTVPPQSRFDGDGTTFRLSLVSYNVWALPVPLPGMDRMGRLPNIPTALAGLNADIVLLQEAFDVRMREFLVQYLHAYQSGPDALCREPMVPMGEKDCTGGLMTLSSFPVTGSRFYVHPVGEGAKLDEKNGRKGFMVTTVESPLGLVDVVNIHLYAGRTSADEEHRLLQFAQLRDVVGGADGSSRPIVLAGDLNLVHPFISARDAAAPASAAYRFLVDSLGFVDTHPEATETDYSYDVTTNQYANVWYNRSEGRQILDYVMVRLPENMTFEVVERRRILDGEAPLSDHYGVYAALTLRRER